jgi:hypothetical protein
MNKVSFCRINLYDESDAATAACHTNIGKSIAAIVSCLLFV